MKIIRKKFQCFVLCGEQCFLNSPSGRKSEKASSGFETVLATFLGHGVFCKRSPTGNQPEFL